MNYLVSRTCTEILPPDAAQNQQLEPQPLAAFRAAPAYVLLGDPGAGKTTAFEVESKAVGDGLYVSARDFLTLNVDAHPEWRGKTLFIDGLDEVRAGTDDVRTPFDAIRGRLDELGKPRFRLSCREADWLGANDRKYLESVAPEGAVTVLRLDPLTDADIITILNAQPGVDDAQKFVEEAQNRGVDGLLTNPQSLELLVRAVAEGGWPESRLDTFERACSHIARERNEEHLIGASPPALGELLEAVGCLCAVQLIAGIAGYTVGPGESDSVYPSPEECGYANRDMLKPALATKLFKAESDTRLVPVHRHIAEFLGARHLAKLIEGGLPSQRVLALMTGADGGVVTEMRGLSAWLAAQCPHARMALIERGPIGVGLYGDIGQFSPEEKRILLEALKHMGERLGSDLASRYWTAAFGPLATADMEPVLREILTDPARDKQHQMLAVFVLRILEEGSPLPGLFELLLDIVYDDARTSSVKVSSLDAFLRTCQDGQEKTSLLKQLLTDIQTGRVADPDDELRRALLTQLYPRDLPASQIWNYLSQPSNSGLVGSYVLFWYRNLLDQSSDEDVSELLDGLQSPPPGLRPTPEMTRPFFKDLPLKLLARGLKAHGDKITIKRLYDWLGVGLPVTRYKSGEEAYSVQVWLEQHPAIQKAILTEGVRRYAESDEEKFSVYIYEVEQRLYGANPPSDFGPWCGEQAKKETDLRVAEYFIRRAGWTGLSLETQWEQTRDRPELQSLISEMIDRSKVEKQERWRQEQDYQREKQSYTEERKQEEKEWLAYVRSNEIALHENRAEAALLDELAKAYFRNFFSNDHGGPEAVEKELQGDQSLIQAALQGLRGTPDRLDVPEPEEILRLRRQGRMSRLEWPFLAGLAEIERTAPEDAAQWDTGRIRKALAFYHCGLCEDYRPRPKWYRRLLNARPEAVAEVQVQFAVSEFHNDSASIYNLWGLAHDPEYALVARYASLPLLRAFPTRCKLKHINVLDYMLWAAIQYADRASFKELIERKLSRTSMNGVQRVHWLAAGLLVSPTEYIARLNDFVQEHERRSSHLTAFFHSRDGAESLFDGLGIQVLELLIRLVGSCCVGPDQRAGPAGSVTPAMKDSDLVRKFIQNLAASPDGDASDALDRLLSDIALSRWHETLAWARDSQRIVRRDAEYRHPTLEQVRETLSGGAPANPGDLAALLVERLQEIATRIRTGNTDDWRQYWNEPSRKEPTPKHEDHCRDALLSDLRQYLPPGIDAQPEGQYASDNRADIRVACRDFQVPIEIKKNLHRELWRAIRNQLIAQYTIDPATGGHGIYLVFWFGRNYTHRSPNGDRPDSPTELKQQLELTLSEDEARKISVCVIDVSRPQA